MAHEEFKLLRDGCMDINQALVKFMAGRTLNSIESQKATDIQRFGKILRAHHRRSRRQGGSNSPAESTSWCW
jgi:hypothetical protein